MVALPPGGGKALLFRNLEPVVYRAFLFNLSDATEQPWGRIQPDGLALAGPGVSNLPRLGDLLNQTG